jgi:heavy metal sensor kinase
VNLSIRFRLTLWYSTVLLAALVLFAVAMSVALEHQLMAGLDTRLAQRVDGLRTVAVEGVTEHMTRQVLQEELVEFTQEVPEGTLTGLADPNGLLLPPPAVIAEQVWSARPAYSTVRWSARNYRVLATRFESGGTDYRVLVAASVSEVETVLQQFRVLLFWLAPAVLAASWLGGYWISRRALRPVDEITRVAKSVSLQNLSARLAVPRTGDELQRMSETWNEVLQRLEASVLRMRQFTADASHELRTPLALISGTAELALRRERSPEEYRQALEAIYSEAGGMTELTESLLSLARTDNGATMPLEPVDAAIVAREVTRECDPVALKKGITLAARAAPDSVTVTPNAPALRRLLMILVDNALKFTPSGGQVTVSAVAIHDGVRLSVDDTGDGIAPEALPHVFERFFQADPSRTGFGAGLGLSIAQAIAQAHGSEITVDSRLGGGSRFELVLKR